jgi:hypothetical protein
MGFSSRVCFCLQAKKERELQMNSTFGSTMVAIVAAMPLLRSMHLLSVGAYVTTLRFKWVMQDSQTFSDVLAAQLYSIVRREFAQGSLKFEQTRAAIDIVGVKIKGCPEQYQRENVRLTLGCFLFCV